MNRVLLRATVVGLNVATICFTVGMCLYHLPELTTWPGLLAPMALPILALSTWAAVTALCNELSEAKIPSA